jgi:hypothetical protein
MAMSETKQEECEEFEGRRAITTTGKSLYKPVPQTVNTTHMKLMPKESTKGTQKNFLLPF